MELFQSQEWQPNCYGLDLNKAVFHVDLDFFKVLKNKREIFCGIHGAVHGSKD